MTSDASRRLTASWSESIAPVVVAPDSRRVMSGLDSITDDEPSTTEVAVLHLVNGEHFSGAERVQSHLGRCLPEFGVRADFACVKPGLFAKKLASQQGRWGQSFHTRMTSRLDLRAAWSIRKLVRRGGYQLIHAHTPRTALLASIAARLSGVPWIYHVHSPAARDSVNLLANRINAWVERLSLLNCRHLITVSESLCMDCIRAGYSEERISIVHNGVPSVDEGIRARRKATPTVGGPWVIGMVELMRPRKGLEIALQSLATVREEHDVTLRIIGSFESDAYEKAIREQVSMLGLGEGVEFAGFTDDVPAELAKLDALILPSLFGEGLPMVVLEAMAFGRPVIATRVEGTPEAVTDGVEGLLAEPNDAESLASRIRDLVTARYDWEAMCRTARQRHALDFSDRAMAEKTAAVYRKILPSPPQEEG